MPVALINLYYIAMHINIPSGLLILSSSSYNKIYVNQLAIISYMYIEQCQSHMSIYKSFHACNQGSPHDISISVFIIKCN